MGSHLSGAGDGVHWTLEPDGDLNANLVHLDPWHEIAQHDNAEVDVLMVVLRGGGHVRIDDVRSTLAPDVVVHLPIGTTRWIEAGPEGLWYLSVHRRRGPLAIGRPSTRTASSRKDARGL